jgi:hypothetical protein
MTRSDRREEGAAIKRQVPTGKKEGRKEQDREGNRKTATKISQNKINKSTNVKERQKETSYIHTERLLRKGDCKKRERDSQRHTNKKTAAKKPIRRQENRQDTHRLL